MDTQLVNVTAEKLAELAGSDCYGSLSEGINRLYTLPITTRELYTRRAEDLLSYFSSKGYKVVKE